MPIFQNIKEKRITYGIPSFDGGLNDTFPQSTLQDNETPDCLNVRFDEQGAVATRYGSTWLNSSITATGSQICDGLFTTNWNNGNQTMIAFFGGTGYAWDGVNTFATIGSAQSIYTAGVAMEGVQYYNIAAFGNGYANNYKYNVTDYTLLGITPPTAFAPTIATISAGAGTLQIGTYNYKMTFVNSFSIESDISSASVAFIPTAGNVKGDITGLPVAPQSHGISSRILYRTKIGASTYYRVTTLSDNTTTTYVDSTPDTSLTVEPPADASIPPKFVKAIAHQERLFLFGPTNPSYLFYSEIGNPFVVKASSYFLMGDGDGGIIKNIFTLGNNIVIQKSNNSTWVLYMADTTPGNWQRKKIIGDTGTLGSRCASAFETESRSSESGIIFAGSQGGKFSGFHLMLGNELIDLSTGNYKTNSISEPIKTSLDDFASSYVQNIAMTHFNGKVYIAVPYGSTSTNNRIYVWDYNRRSVQGKVGAFIPWTGMSASCFTVYSNKLYYGSSTAIGRVCRMEIPDQYNDNSSAIDSYYWTKIYRGQKNMETNRKDFRNAYLWIKCAGVYNMNLNYRLLGDNGAGDSVQIDLDPTGTLWDVAKWDVDIWDDGTDQKQVLVRLGRQSGEGIQFKFSNQNTVNQFFKVFKMDFDFNLLQTRR